MKERILTPLTIGPLPSDNKGFVTSLDRYE